MTPAKSQRRKGRNHCHFNRREKSILDPWHRLGMSGFGPSLGDFAPLRESFLILLFRRQNPLGTKDHHHDQD